MREGEADVRGARGYFVGFPFGSRKNTQWPLFRAAILPFPSGMCREQGYKEREGGTNGTISPKARKFGPITSPCVLPPSFS